MSYSSPTKHGNGSGASCLIPSLVSPLLTWSAISYILGPPPSVRTTVCHSRSVNVGLAIPAWIKHPCKQHAIIVHAVTLTLTRWPSYTNLICIPWRYTCVPKMDFLGRISKVIVLQTHILNAYIQIDSRVVINDWCQLQQFEMRLTRTSFDLINWFIVMKSKFHCKVPLWFFYIY